MKHDYVAEIELPAEELTARFKAFLQQKLNMGTETLQASQDHVSEDASGSLTRTIIQSRPSRIRWNVENTGPKQCHLTMDFGFSRQFRWKVCVLSVILGLCPFLGAPDSPVSVTQAVKTAYGLDLGILSSIVHVCVATAHLALLSFLGYSLWRYVRFAPRIFTGFSRKFPDVVITHERPHPLDQRLLADWKVFAFCGCALLAGGPLSGCLSGDGEFLFKYVFLPCLLPALVLLIVAIHALAGSMGSVKVAQLGNNLVCALSAIALLFVFPAVLHYVMEHVIPRVFAAPQPLAVLAMLVVLHLFIFIVALMMAVGLGYSTGRAIAGPEREHQNGMRRLFRSNSEQALQSNTTNVSLPLRFVVWAEFLALSLVMWLAIYQNISILIAFLLPKRPSMHFGWGRTIYAGIELLGNPLSPVREIPTQYLSIFLVGPLLATFGFFVILNAAALAHSQMRWRYLVPLNNEIADMTQKIARIMGVGKVRCMVDTRSSRPSPSARVIGWRPRCTVIFTAGSLRFFADHPQYMEVVIAHELGHLERDSKKIWIYSILSRLALVGTAFLSVTVDSVAMEDDADNFACRYLCRKAASTFPADAPDETTARNKEIVNVLRNAVDAMETAELLHEESERLGLPFASSAKSDVRTRAHDNATRAKACLKVVFTSLVAAYRVYFLTDMYEYLHRESHHRGTSFGITTEHSRMDRV